ncbi:MAG TPA: extracellular solute-binding protein [Roseiflexaceae bacterium]|nr:extracellular solute-binding protein [Roseiflexaceae bacterium]
MRRLLSLFLLIALLAACSGPADPPPGTPEPGQTDATNEPVAQPGEDGPVTISYAIWDYEQQLYEPLAKKFNAEHPNITIALVSLDDMMNVPREQQAGPENPLSQLRRIVSGADTAPAFALTPEAFGSGLMLDLAPLMDADSAFKRDDFLPGALEQYASKGGSWVLPRYLNVQVLSYNKELFKGAGLPEPKVGWTWTDLLGAAEQLAKKSGSKVDTYGYLDSSGGFLPLIALLQDQGVDLLNTPAQKVKLDGPEVLAAVKRLRELIDSGALFRPVYKEGADPLDPNQLIRDGKVALWGQEFVQIADGPGPADQQQEYGFPVGKAPYPSTFAGFYGGGADGYIISAGTAHPNESWQWIEFLSRQQTDQSGGPIPYYTLGRIPARLSLAEQTGFWDSVDAETAAAYKWAIAHPAPPMERTPDYAAFGALSGVLEQILGAEKKDPQKALQEAQRSLETQLAETQLTPTPEPDTSPVVVATPEPQAAPEGAITINFSVDGYNPSDIRRVARAFRDVHPEIFVQIKATTSFTEPSTLTKVAQTSDCFSWYAPPQTDEDFKALLDLKPLFDADASFPIDDFAPVLLAPYQRDAALFGLPYAATLRTLNFNRTAFEAAGIQPPSYQWKPDDFLAAAQALTKGEGDKKQFGYVPLSGAQQDLMFFVGQFGGRLVNGSGRDARPNFDDSKVVQAIQWYLDLNGAHKVMPPVKFPYKRDDPGFEDKSYEYVQNGRAAMWFDQGYGMFGGPEGIPPVKDPRPGAPLAPNFEVGIAPLPIGGGGLSSSDFYLRGFHISAKTEQSQACWEWLKFLSADVNNLQGGVPARTSVRISETFTKQADPATLALANTYAEALQARGSSGQGGDPNAFYGMDSYWFFKALSEAQEKKTPLDQGLAEAQRLTSAFMDCLERAANKPATCAAQVDPKYQGYNTEDPPEGQPGFPRG